MTVSEVRHTGLIYVPTYSQYRAYG